MATRIIKYRAQDGTEHQTEKAADEHDSQTLLRKNLTGLFEQHIGGLTSAEFKGVDAAVEVLCKHREYAITLLVGKQKRASKPKAPAAIPAAKAGAKQ